jgi:uncharacterized protein YkvS
LVDWSFNSLYKDGITSAEELANQALFLAQQLKIATLSQVYNILEFRDGKRGSRHVEPPENQPRVC